MQYDLKNNANQSIISRMQFAFILSVMVIGSMIVTAEPAMAQQSPMGNVVCSLIGIIYGNLGRGLAILSVIIVGVGATIGKVSWGLAITVATGIATVFGAVPLVAYIIANDATAQMCYGAGGVQ